MEKQAIAFAFYKNNELIGYRQDTIGSIGNSPKIYHYSKKQVETVLKNVESNVKNNNGIGKALINHFGPQRELSMLANSEKNVHNMLQDKKAFELRVVKAPNYEKIFNVKKGEWEVDYLGGYPHEAIQEWLKHPETHEFIETHYFSLIGKMNLQ